MQIKEIVVYATTGEVRRIELSPGALNVITGESRTGKSAVLEIIRYCLGSEELRTPEGPVSSAASWFGLHLAFPGREAFVGRPLPPPGQATTNAAMLRVGNPVEVPTAGELLVNANTETLIDALGRMIGIEENEAVLPAGAGRLPVQATLAHALFFCLQRQHEIANQDLLFHRQGEQFIPTHIRDVLPYFLGAVPSDHLVLRARVRRAREELLLIEDRIERAQAITSNEVAESRALVSEAQNVGLLAGFETENLNVTQLREYLETARDAVLEGIADGVPEGAAFLQLRNEQATIASQYRELQETRRLAQSLVREQAEFESAADLQLTRMEAVQLLPDSENSDHCPVCEQQLARNQPTVTQLRADLAQLREELTETGRDEPRLQRLLAEVEGGQDTARERLGEIDTAMRALARQYHQISELRGRLDEQSYVRGRIDHYLQVVGEADVQDLDSLENRRAQLAQSIQALEAEIGHDAVRENVTSILNVVGEDMQTWARRLELEYSQGRVRIDLSRLTVVADTASGTVPLTRMGSAANWVGYHLVAHLALHKFFIEHDRPVPRFLILDQPTQAFYPPDRAPQPLGDADRIAVNRMFKLLDDVAKELRPSLQILVTDHLLLRDEWFTEAIVENWRDGNALIPAAWVTSADGPDQ